MTKTTTTRLDANAGMDAFSAQLAEAANGGTQYAAITNSPMTTADSVATEMMNGSRTAVVEESLLQSDDEEYPKQYTTNTNGNISKHGIGDLLMQRAIQTQLYYLADLRDEPTYMWLRDFMGHNHLDDRGQFNELDGLRCSGGWQTYLTHLEEAPHFSIVVELAPPKLNAQQRRNPYLAAQSSGKTYEETIMPSQISQTLRTVARSLEREWVPILYEMIKADRERVQLHSLPYPQLQTVAAAYQANLGQQIVAGGEGDDDGTPLHAFNERMVKRFCTRVTLDRIQEEVRGISLPVVEVLLPPKEVSSSNSGETDFAAADASAEQWISQFAREWVPRLIRGADDDRRRQLGVAPPGHWQRLCDGADADDVTEALWQELPQLFAYISDDAMDLYSPEAMAARLRRVRADVCEELVEELRDAVYSMSS